MNVYDFDKTIFYPDSSTAFIKFCFKKHPFAVAAALLGSIPAAIGYILSGKADATALKENLFSFLNCIRDLDGTVADFWKKNEWRIGRWYLAQRRDDDVIISASPEFLHRPIAEKLGFALVGTRMDTKTGKISGKNCHDEEKVRRFRQLYPEAVPDAFYSDSLSDTPMAMLAEKALLVRKGELYPWPDK